MTERRWELVRVASGALVLVFFGMLIGWGLAVRPYDSAPDWILHAEFVCVGISLAAHAAAKKKRAVPARAF